MNPQLYTHKDLFDGPVVIVMTTETLRGQKIQDMGPWGILLLEELTEKTLRFIPWTAVKQIYRKVK